MKRRSRNAALKIEECLKVQSILILLSILPFLKYFHILRHFMECSTVLTNQTKRRVEYISFDFSIGKKARYGTVLLLNVKATSTKVSK